MERKPFLIPSNDRRPCSVDVGRRTPPLPPSHPLRQREAIIERLRARIRRQPLWLDGLHELWNDIAERPASHFLVAVLTICAWTVLLVLPTLVLK